MTTATRPEPGPRPAAEAVSAPLPVRNRAIAANSGIVLLSLATGGLGADLLQLYAAQVLGLSPSQVGLTLGLLILSVPAQVVAAGRAGRRGPRRTMRWGYAAILGCLLVFPWVRPLLTVNRGAGFALFIAVVLGVETAISCTWAIVWWAWMQDLVRPPQRGSFLGRMRLTAQSVAAIALVVVSLPFHSRVSYAGYNILLGALACYVLVALRLFGRMPDRVPEASAGDAPAGGAPAGGGMSQLGANLRALAGHRPARTLLGVLLLTQLMTAPLLSTYLLDVVALSPGTISRLIAVRTIAGIVALRRWGPIIDSYGAKRVQIWTAAAVGVSTPLWLAVRTSSAGGPGSLLGWPLVLLIGLVSAVALSGFGLAYLVDMQDTIPPALATTAFAVQDIVSSSAAQLSFLLAGLLVAAAGCGGQAGGCPATLLDPYRTLLVCGLPAALLAVVLQRRARAWTADPPGCDQAPGPRQDNPAHRQENPDHRQEN